jgi:hypothetical protein
MQKPPYTGHHCSVPFEVPHIDMCTFESSARIGTPPYTGLAACYGPSGVRIMEVSVYYCFLYNEPLQHIMNSLSFCDALCCDLCM